MRDLNALGTRLGIPFLLAGAAARDILLVNLWGLPAYRSTADVDFAFAVVDWSQFEMLCDELIQTGHLNELTTDNSVYCTQIQNFTSPFPSISFRSVASPPQTGQYRGRKTVTLS